MIKSCCTPIQFFLHHELEFNQVVALSLVDKTVRRVRRHYYNSPFLQQLGVLTKAHCPTSDCTLRR